ncbi:MAG: sigma-54 dependent transcriptional regulator, partial [Calditrichia bacterium]
MLPRLLVIDDDESLLKSIHKILTLYQYKVETLSNPAAVEDRLLMSDYNCILMDVKMPGINGLELLDRILKSFPTVPVIMISGQSNIETAVEALKKGAYDFIEKPIDADRMLLSIRNALQKQDLQLSKDNIYQELIENHEIVSQSPAMRQVFNQIHKLAATHVKVLITGESGTGKELVAWALHHYSNRNGNPYIKLNCAAVPSELLESELFGHRKGSFTGATENREGKFAAANNGTLFLDEIGDMDFALQAKLLRVLEEGEIEVIGENTPRKVDVRIIAATNKNIKKMVQEGLFRQDLYHRLRVAQIDLPPLRKRREDILPLAYHFLKKFCNEYNKQVVSFSRRAEATLLNQHWAGNVRELRNIVEKAVIFSEESEIKVDEILRGLESKKSTYNDNENGDEDELLTLKQAESNFEKNYIVDMLNLNEWKIAKTAEALGIDRTNLFKKMKKLGIEKH